MGRALSACRVLPDLSLPVHMTLTDIFALIALAISLFSFGFTYRVMRGQLTEDTGADLHEAVMRLIEIQGSMPDHPNTTRNAKNQVHHLALMVESLIEHGGDDLRVPVTGYLALGWSFELVGEDEKAERHHQTACRCDSANTPFSHALTHRSLGRYYFNRGRRGDLASARDAFQTALVDPRMNELDSDDAAEMDAYTLLQWAKYESREWARHKSLAGQTPEAPKVLERARARASAIEDPLRRQKVDKDIEDASLTIATEPGDAASDAQTVSPTAELDDYSGDAIETDVAYDGP
jgi:hypothetical protein